MVDPELVVVLSELLASLADVTEQKTVSHVTFYTEGKVFAFTRATGQGVALKLPKERIAALLEQRDDITPLKMGKRTMKEWVLVERAKLSAYRKDLALFQEAMAFVGSTGEKK
ncbi:MAG: MmcQ/YjbR family DNA-binding protein [Acidobacteriota bacterium]|nr:MmcQ/YjbR family DNA-binding protein [Acidobacteriota bacterium]